MIARAYRRIQEMRRRGTALVALVALLGSVLTFLETPPPANAAIVNSNLVLNLDASNTSSLASTGATGWNSVSPASSAATSTFSGNTARVTDSTGASISLDGNADAAVFPVGTARTPGSMTVETWVKPGDLRAGWNILGSRWFYDSARNGNSTSNDWHFAIYGTSAGNMKLQLNNYGSLFTGNTIFPLTSANKWYHLAFTIDAENNNTATLWVNGVADGSISNFPHTDSATAQLHVGDVGVGSTFNGNMSRFRIYNTALTSAQMAQNFLTDSANYGYAPVNTVVPSISGIAKVGTPLSANAGTWGVGDADGTTTAYKWQTSSDGSTGWTDIAGAISATYTPVANDATNYLRVVVTKTNTAGTASANSSATLRVQTSSGTALVSGGKLTSLTTTVPNDSTTYNVTLATNNLSATMQLGTTTGLTVVNGYASTASYMAATIGAAAPIISFRGTGTAINTALANVTYNSATKQTDVVKLYYATASASLPDTENYIPIYDNNQLKFHYYAHKTHAANKDRPGMEAALVGLTTTDDVQAPGPWYLGTPRYSIEWDRIKAISGLNATFMGAKADAGSSSWYWPANTDGYTTATTFGTQSGSTVTATSNIFNQSNTTLPFHTGEPNGGTTIARTGYMYISNSTLGWDDVPMDCSCSPHFVMETYGTAPFNTGSTGVLAQTVNVVSSYADAPTNLSAAASGTSSIVLGWSPTTANTTGFPITGYRLEASTSSSFSPVIANSTQSTANSGIITGLAANTQYYVRVMATTAAGNATPTAAQLITTTASATTLTVVSSGGGVAGTDYSLINGFFAPKSGLSVNINAAEIQNVLATRNAFLAADNVVINAPITWNAYPTFFLGNSPTSSVSINKSITASSGSAWIVINPNTYSLDVKSGASINFPAAGTNNRIYVGNVFHTVLKSEADLATVVASGKYALGKPITLANTYTASPIPLTFTGSFDGLGNTLDSMKLNISTGTSAGLIQNLNGGTIRNLGVTNISTNVSNTSGTANVGAIVGQSTGGTLDQVWSTGLLQTASATAMGGVSLGGLVGNTSAGTTTVSKSWSSVNITTANSTSISNMMAVGSLVGSDVAAAGQASTSSGGNISMSQVYSTGGLATGNFSVWRGHGGLIGLHYSAATISITDAFAWSNHLTTDTSGVGGIVGNADGGAVTLTNVYTRQATATWVAARTTNTNVQFNVVPGAAVSAQSGTNWVTDATNGTYLKNIAKPFQNIYYQVVAPLDGSYSGMSTRVVDGAGQVQTLSSLNLSTTGTPVYTILSNAAKATYNVSYVSGLTLGGSASGLYNSAPWPFTTSVTISRFSQTLTWAPTTAISFGSGSFTPSAAPVSSAGSTISYAITNAGTTGCTVNSSTGVVTYTAAGSCEVTATAAQTTDYASATVAKTFVIGEAATAPTVTTEAATSNSIVVSWTAPTVDASASLTEYQIIYSTSADMSSPTTINTGNTGTARLITGLSSGTTYYFKVRAIGGSTWIGPYNSTAVTGSPKNFSTTITVVASGGGTLGTDYKIANGIVYTTAGSANVNVADIQSALLTNDVTIASGNIVIDAPITWATSETLTLGTTSDGSLTINQTLSASGVNGGLVITPTSYTLKTQTGAEIILSGASSTLSIGGNAYTLIRSVSDLASVATSGNYALAKPIAFSGNISASPINLTFTGTFDGLGNTVDLMRIRPTANGSYGFFSYLNGATVRNLGVTRAWTSIATNVNLTQISSGVLAGETSGTTSLTQVWTTGHNDATMGTITRYTLGGLVGNATSGTTTFTRAWSSVSLNSNGATISTIAIGGLLGTNSAVVGDGPGIAGGSVVMNQVYSTGNIYWQVGPGHRGYGGLIGLPYSTGTVSITDAFSWSVMRNVDANYGGLIGAPGNGAINITRAYTTSATATWGSASQTLTSVSAGITLGANVGNLATSNWASSGTSKLVNLQNPLRPAFVVVTAPTNGAYNTMGYSVVDGLWTSATLASLGLTVSGTPTYSIASDVAIGTHNVSYVSGLTLGGTNGSYYSLDAWLNPTSVTISKVEQSVSWYPTTSVSFGSGSFTPSSLASASTAITYALNSAGTSNCSVNASTGVISYTSGGSCAITANAANSGNYLAASKTVTFTIAEASTAPVVTATAASNNSIMLSWTAPTVNASTALTGYQITYSTAVGMTSPTTVTTTNTNTSRLIAGLTSGTTYYFQVRAVNGSSWFGTANETPASSAPKATTTTITVVASGGGVSGTDFRIVDGVIYTTSSSVSINASDIQSALLTGNITLAADNIVLTKGLAWSTSQTLTLGTSASGSLTINDTINASGTTAGLVITPNSYTLNVRSGAKVVLSGSAGTLSIGGNAFTLIRSIADLSSVTATGRFALSKPLTFGTTPLTAAPINLAFTGTFDGLGNSLDGMNFNAQNSVSAGLFQILNSGALVRNLGVTNININIPTSAANWVSAGAITGFVNDTTSGTVTLNKVWSTGFISGKSGTSANLILGGLVSWARGGTLNVSQSWSSVNIDTSGLTATSLAVGGLVGADVNVMGQSNSSSGANLNLTEVYTTGYVKTKSTGWRGTGGILGIHYSSATTNITDAFSWGIISTGQTTNVGGIAGPMSGGPSTQTRTYTTNSYCYDGLTTGCTNNVVLGSTVAAMNTAAWTTSNGSSLTNLPAPTRQIYVQVLANTNGTYETVSRQIVDSVGTVLSEADLTAAGISVTGTPIYSITSSSAISATPYSVSYVSGMSVGGTKAALYTLSPWRDTTAVTISKFNQEISFSSTNPGSLTVAGTYTPLATSTSNLVVVISIDATSSSVCSISSGVVSFQSVGTCKVNANQAGNNDYVAATQVQQSFNVGVGDQTISISSTATNARVGSSYTPVGSATSGLPIAFTVDEASTSVCSISIGIVIFSAVGNCTLNANQAGNSNWNAAEQMQQEITVSKGLSAIEITSEAPVNAAVGTTYTVTSSKTQGNENLVVYSIDPTTSAVCSVVDNEVRFLLVGDCQVNANLEGDEQYEAAAQVQQVISVTKGLQVVAFTSQAPTGAKVGATNYTATVTAGSSSSPAVITVDSSTASNCSVSGSVVTYLAVGNCVLNLNQAGDDNYLAAAQVQQVISITEDGRCPFGVVSGNYCLFRFNSSGSWNVPAGVTEIDVLAVGAGGAGGGGAGGNTSPGGGGGGEVLEIFSRTVTPGTVLSASIGAGGIGGGALHNATASTNGGATSVTGSGFATITSRGGGAGATFNFTTSTGLPAGAGANVAGGGGGNGQAGGTSTIAPGVGAISTGGNGYPNSTNAALQTGGGGGGAGGNGGNGTSSAAGSGGAGKNSTILGTILGGGGGGAKRQSVSGSAGSAAAGGGAGGLASAGTPGVANTGGGGGGSAGSNNGANGGSGLVVIRIAMQSQTVSFSTSAPTGIVFGSDATYTPAASGAESGSPVVITVDVSSSAVCEIADGVVSVIGAGTCTLNANQAGIGYFADAAQVQQSFTVAKQAQTISFTSTVPTNAVVDGTTYEVAATSGGSGLEVTFSISDSSSEVCSIEAGVISFTSTGDCVVEANQTGNSNFEAASLETQTITVSKGFQAVAFTSLVPQNARVNGSTYTLTATGGASGSAVEYSVDPASSTICSISGAEVSFIGAGDCVVLADQAGNNNYLAADQVSQTISVAKGVQSVAFTSTAPIDAVVDGLTYELSGTGGDSGEAIVFSIHADSAEICELTGTEVSFVGAGDCIILLDQAGNDNYLAAPTEQQVITVGRGAQVVEFSSELPTGSVVGGGTYSPAATGGASGNAVSLSIDEASVGVCAINAGVVRNIGVGDCIVIASQVGNENYLPASATQTYTVGKGSQTINFSSIAPESAVVRGATYTPTATGGSSLNSVTFTIAEESSAVCKLTAGVVSFQSPGTCEVLANQLGNTNYNAAQIASQSFTVGKGAQVVSITSTAPTTAKVGGITYQPVATKGPGVEPVVFSVADGSETVCLVTAGVVSFIGAGTCVIEANQAGDTNYNAATTQTQSFTVAKGIQVLSFTSEPPHDAEVAGTHYTPTATGGASGEAIVFTIAAEAATKCSIDNDGQISFQLPGDCIVYATQAGNANYLAATRISQVFDITKGQQIVAFTSVAPSAAVVDGTVYVPTSTGGAGTMPVTYRVSELSTEVCSVLDGEISFQATGDCTVFAEQAGDDRFNAANPVSQTFSVGKGSQAVTFSSIFIGARVGGATYTPTATAGPSESAVEFTIASESTTVCEINGNGVVWFLTVGDCVIEANQDGDGNYLPAPQETQTITVSKGVQLAFTVTSSLDNLRLGTTPPTAVVSFSGGSGTGDVVWSVAPDSIEICSISGDVVTGLSVGWCELTATKASDENYELAEDRLSISVSAGGQAPLRTSVNNDSPTYAPNLSLVLSVSGGDGSGDNWFESLTPSVCEVSGANGLDVLTAGTCIVVGHKDGDGNFQAAQNTLTFTIAKATMSDLAIATADDLTYSESGPVSTELSLNGALSEGAQTFSIVEGSCELASGTLSATEAGLCIVEATVDGDSRYLPRTVQRTITIAKAVQANLVATLTSGSSSTIAWAGSKTTNYEIEGGSGTSAISVATSTPTICSLETNGSTVTVTGLAQGTCEVTATKAADSNFLVKTVDFEVTVLDLPSAPQSFALTNGGAADGTNLNLNVTWEAPAATATQAELTGYEVQTRTENTEWATVEGGLLAADATNFTISAPAWSQLFVRVAPISALDPEADTTRNWVTLTEEGTNVELPFDLAGELTTISTTLAAVTSGEVVTLEGTGFDPLKTTRVQITTGTAVFTASIGRAAAVNTKTVVATVLSPTKLTFVLPKITMPKGRTTLPATVQVLTVDNVLTEAVDLTYIPKKLTQTVAVTGLPATKAVLNIASGEVSGVASSTGVSPEVTALPANVCTASIVNGEVEIDPIGRGTCTVTVKAPATPGFTASAAKTYAYTIKGAAQTLTFTNPGPQTWSTDVVSLVGTATLNPVFTSKTPTVCTISGSSLTMVKAGLCTVIATQPGDALNEPATVAGTTQTSISQSFTIAKKTRTTGLTATLTDVFADGTKPERTLTYLDSSIVTAANISVVVGDNPLELPVRLNRAEGTVLFSVASADASRCLAEPGTDDPTLALITVSDLGSCKVTITLPADDRWNAHADKIVIWINATALPQDGVNPTPTGTGDGVLANQDLYFDNNPLDKDSDPAVLLAQTGESVTANLGGDLSMAYDAVTGKYQFRSKTLLVGKYTAKMTGPAGTAWFAKASTITVCTKYSKGKCVKSIKQPTVLAVNECVATLTVKKDPKLKKRVLRIIGSGCQLNEAGKAAFNQTGVQNIIFKYQWIRQYPSTGLDHVKKGKTKVRFLKKVKRTVVLSVGRPN